ncbi:MAG TPA: N-acetyltransferase [Chthoniobacteraceae bacterium]|jgi:ribosomal protein S18 acetylase RimI-like enzyme|nr:N-acetyltransferase [Chthoniobacteraceae bacterium]
MPTDAGNANRGEMAIRRYTAADWEDVCHIHDESRVQELFSGGVDPRAFRTMAEVAQSDEFFASETLLAYAGESIAGFISWNGAYITWLYVLPAYQRRGIGRRLLDEALRRIGPHAWTNIIAGNEPALAVYRAFGMEPVWTRPADCEGYVCNMTRLALPDSPMRDPSMRREPRRKS